MEPQLNVSFKIIEVKKSDIENGQFVTVYFLPLKQRVIYFAYSAR